MVVPSTRNKLLQSNTVGNVNTTAESKTKSQIECDTQKTSNASDLVKDRFGNVDSNTYVTRGASKSLHEDHQAQQKNITDYLDTTMRCMEGQVQQLKTYVQSLSNKLADDRTENKFLESHIDKAFSSLRTTIDGERKRDNYLKHLKEIYLLPKNDFRQQNRSFERENTLSYVIYNIKQTYVSSQITLRQQLLQLFQEERLSRQELKAQYAKQLDILRAVMEGQRQHERRKVTEKFDGLIQKYHSLAVEATELAHLERERTRREKAKIQDIAKAACKVFEQEIRERTHGALDEYHKAAKETHIAANREKAELASRCSNLEQEIDKERRTFETQVVREAEKRVSYYRDRLSNVTTELKKNAADCKTRLNDFCNKIESSYILYERNLLSKLLEVLWSNGIDLEESDLYRMLTRLKYDKNIVEPSGAHRRTETGQMQPKTSISTNNKQGFYGFRYVSPSIPL